MDIKKSAVLVSLLFFGLMIFACDRGGPTNSKKTSEQTINTPTTLEEDTTVNTPIAEEIPTTTPIDDNIPSEDTAANPPTTNVCVADNFQTINIGQDIATDCENNQIAFSFLRTDDTLLIKISLNATERIFGVNLEILYPDETLEFISYEKGEFFGTDSVTLYNTIEVNACNKNLILGHTRLGYQTTGSDGAGIVGTLKFKIISSSKIQFQILNATVHKRFFDEDPIPRVCLPLKLVLN